MTSGIELRHKVLFTVKMPSHPDNYKAIVSAAFLRAIPTEMRREELERQAMGIRSLVCQVARCGETKYHFKISTGNTGVKSHPEPPVITTEELIGELIRTLEGCKVTHVTALKGEYGYSRPECIEIDWS